MVSKTGAIPILIAAVIGLFLMKSGGKSLTMISAALAVVILIGLYKGKS
jgi:hypothetical protein